MAKRGPKGPTKYTEGFVLGELNSFLERLREDKDREIIYINQLFEKKTYCVQCFSEWANNFEKNEEISEAIKKVKEVLQSRVVTGMMKNKLNPTGCIFHLKNNYGWKDKQDINLGGQKDNPLEIDFRNMTESELGKYLLSKLRE